MCLFAPVQELVQTHASETEAYGIGSLVWRMPPGAAFHTGRLAAALGHRVSGFQTSCGVANGSVGSGSSVVPDLAGGVKSLSSLANSPCGAPHCDGGGSPGTHSNPDAAAQAAALAASGRGDGSRASPLSFCDSRDGRSGSGDHEAAAAGAGSHVNGWRHPPEPGPLTCLRSKGFFRLAHCPQLRWHWSTAGGDSQSTRCRSLWRMTIRSFRACMVQSACWIGFDVGWRLQPPPALSGAQAQAAASPLPESGRHRLHLLLQLQMQKRLQTVQWRQQVLRRVHCRMRTAQSRHLSSSVSTWTRSAPSASCGMIFLKS